ncbi:hypothetical protein FQR65_LT05144 [Abscondita terminalis]|nr:hypothetical protein FQR65_LT05144 [Abscondita terminalis]
MLTIGDKFPEFSVKAVISSNSKDAFTEINHQTYSKKWQIIFFWPKDFTFVCPTEIAAFGASTDSEFVHLAWRQQKDELRDLPFPMLADITRELAQSLGILDKKEGVAQRATFIVDPESMIRFVMVTDLSVGRNAKEVLRILDALQTDELCPCNWQKGEATITVD